MQTQYAKYNNVEYVMPFMFCNDLFIPALNKLFENEKNPIKYVYGTVRCAWAGGRPSSLSISSIPKIDQYLKKIKKYNLTPVFTFNCKNENKEILNDSFCNELLDVAYQNDAHIIVATDMLYKYITSKYKDAHMVCSVIMPHLKVLDSVFFNETKFYNDMLDKYEIVVVRPEWAMENIEKIDKVINDIGRIEILINQNCSYNCKSAKLHYELHEQLEARTLDSNEYNQKVLQICPKYKKDYRTVHMQEEVVDKLVSKGVKLIKMQGRDLPFDDLLNDFYKFLFTDKINKEQIEKEINSICSQLIKNNKAAQLNLL